MITHALIFLLAACAQAQVVLPACAVKSVCSQFHTSSITMDSGVLTFPDGTTMGTASSGGTTPLSQPTVMTSGSGTYTTPVGARMLYVVVMGDASGGSGAAGGGPDSGAGTGTYFGGNNLGTNLLVASGGQPSSNYSGGLGGTTTITSGFYGLGVTGGNGPGPQFAGAYATGAPGCSSPLGGAGSAVGGSTPSTDASPNSGSGGGGASSTAGGTNWGGAGGACGGYIKAWTVGTPQATYNWAVGPGGAGSSNGGGTGGKGGSGSIQVFASF